MKLLKQKATLKQIKCLNTNIAKVMVQKKSLNLIFLIALMNSMKIMNVNLKINLFFQRDSRTTVRETTHLAKQYFKLGKTKINENQSNNIFYFGKNIYSKY